MPELSWRYGYEATLGDAVEVDGTRHRRLLEDDVLACVERSQRQLEVRGRRRHHRNRIDVRRSDRFIVGREGVTAELAGEPLGALGVTAREAHRDLAAVAAQSLCVCTCNVSATEEREPDHAATIVSAARSAFAAIVRLGLTPADMGSALPSVIHRLSMPAEPAVLVERRRRGIGSHAHGADRM
jgi:hypothetical protein